MRKKKILIACANAGAGHIKAAFAVEKALKKIAPPEVEIKVIDTLDYCTRFLKKSYPAVYLFLVKRIPTLWGLGYYLFDSRIIYRLFIAPARRISNFLNCAGLTAFLKQYNPDVIINTHFLGVEVASDMRRQGMLKETELITIVTDYLMHSFWVDKRSDYYCVAQNESKEHLIKRGISPERIKVFGIPIDGIFASRGDKKDICARLNIRDDLRTVLVGSGGFGVGPVKELVKELAGIKGIQLLVICGKNPELHKDISELAGSLEISVRAYEFVDNMHELMDVSDIIVTKSGGMTSSEAMAKDLPMVITSAIPGQEARNCRYLVGSGAAVYAGGVEAAKKAISDMLDSEAMMTRLKKRIGEVKKPNASRDIARFALSLLN